MDITSGTGIAPSKHPHTHGEAFQHWIEGMHIQFPKFKHDHPVVINVNKVADEQMTVGQRVADKVAVGMGSWRFIIIQSCILLTWIVLNTIQLFFKPFDAYPYILLNLTLSFQAAFAAPFIMISQNRQAQKDRLRAQTEVFQNLPPEKQETVRKMFRRFNNLPEDRRQPVRQELRQLRGMSEADRNARMNSEEFRNKYSPGERQILENLTVLVPQE